MAVVAAHTGDTVEGDIPPGQLPLVQSYMHTYNTVMQAKELGIKLEGEFDEEQVDLLYTIHEANIKLNQSKQGGSNVSRSKRTN